MTKKHPLYIDGYNYNSIDVKNSGRFLRKDGYGAGFSWDTTTTRGTNISELWARPKYPHSYDDEFDSDTLNPAWQVLGGSVDVGTVDTYDTTFTSGDPRVNLNPETRRSWLICQPASGSYRFIYKSITFPENMVVIARMRFNQSISISDTDNTLSLNLFPDNGSGSIDVTNRYELFLNEADNSVTQGQQLYYTDNTPDLTFTTTNVRSKGQALQYLAFHKRGNEYSTWWGTNNGNFIYSYTETITDRVFEYVGFGFANTTTSNPGVKVMGVDFIRFYETDNFLF